MLLLYCSTNSCSGCVQMLKLQVIIGNVCKDVVFTTSLHIHHHPHGYQVLSFSTPWHVYHQHHHISSSLLFPYIHSSPLTYSHTITLRPFYKHIRYFAFILLYKKITIITFFISSPCSLKIYFLAFNIKLQTLDTTFPQVSFKFYFMMKNVLHL